MDAQSDPPMEAPSVQRLTSARIPTIDGEFTLALYENTSDDKDHLALIHGDIDGQEDVLVRIHSECFTGDVLGSLRCDCGEQLNASIRRIAREGAGVLLYLRQEGRGIGLLDKLKAYNLQDEGYDTVEANQLLGHGADERDYSIGAHILDNLDLRSIRLLTNNPEKIEALRDHGISVTERIPVQPHLNRHNTDYLQTKVNRMRHLLELGPLSDGEHENPHGTDLRGLQQRAHDHFRSTGDPFVTLSYAQSLDGSIASSDRSPLSISGDESLSFTHQVRAAHDAILVGIGTILNDNPRLNVRYTEGTHPTPVVLDSQLRFPLDARLLSREGPAPIIATNESISNERKRRLEDRNATVIQLSCAQDGICLTSLLESLAERNLQSVMVEGGSEVITSFLSHRLVDHLILTIAPMFVGGRQAVHPVQEEDSSGPLPGTFPTLTNVQYRWMGEDLIMEGTPVWMD